MASEELLDSTTGKPTATKSDYGAQRVVAYDNLGVPIDGYGTSPTDLLKAMHQNNALLGEMRDFLELILAKL